MNNASRTHAEVVNVGLFVRLEAKPGKEAEVARFLREESLMLQQCPVTTAWFAMRLGPSMFGIFECAWITRRGRSSCCRSRRWCRSSL
jgi:hypothetical protein